jgi:hypothetical protein
MFPLRRRFLPPIVVAAAAVFIAASLPAVHAQLVRQRVIPVAGQPIAPPVPEGPGVAAAPTAAVSDAEALKSAGLTETDGPKLIEYLKQRTLSDADQGKITVIIKRFGGDDFDDRVKATEEIEIFGPAAVGPLKTAERDPDPEVAFRARQALKKMAKIPHSAVASATVRAVLKLKPAGAAEALIGFLPLADDEVVASAIREALVALAVKDGKADPALMAALTDVSPLRRGAAYVALVTGGPAGERVRIKDAYPSVREAVLKETDPEARFIGLWSLLMTTREKEFLPELIAMIPRIGRGRIWQLEELLLQLAGKHPPNGRFLKSPEALAQARDAWLGWWKEKGESINLASFDFRPRVQGNTDIIEIDNRGFAQGRIVSLGPDFKEKWKILRVNNPLDIAVVGEDRLFIAETNSHMISERKFNGEIINKFNVYQSPMYMSLMPGGGMVVICRNLVAELDKTGKQVAAYPRPNFDIMTGHRLPGGDVLFVTNAFNGPNCIRLDSKLKETKKTYAFGRVQYMQSMDVIDDDTVLVCEFDKVAEYDLKSGKQTWKYECAQPSSCQRLPNGNTLIGLVNANKGIEVDPSGEIVWEYQARDGLRVGRVRRR